MKKLWAPWRRVYVSQKARGCFLCRYLREKNDRRNFVIQRTEYSFSLLNLYPYNNGHLMIAPKRHVGDLADLKTHERGDLIDLFIVTKRLCERILKPHGFNAGINFGRAAGAGLEGHLHVHLVPRWHADTNFMPVCAETKVISDSLKGLYRRFESALKEA